MADVDTIKITLKNDAGNVEHVLDGRCTRFHLAAGNSTPKWGLATGSTPLTISPVAGDVVYSMSCTAFQGKSIWLNPGGVSTWIVEQLGVGVG